MWSSVLLAVLSLCCYVELVKVKINEGWLDGEEREASTGLGKFYSFKGIPYAEPPVGDLRFKSPLPRKPWNKTRSAREHGPVCTQYDIFTDRYLPGSEDCLFLNVYTPWINPKSPLPVLFFIHGGAWKSGSGNDDNYGPDFLMHYDIILVTINYRLDVLGFLSLDTKDVPGNAGMKDQVLALKWVHDNIGNFGGDPNQVTIMGQSAGGASVIYHMMSTVSRGLFKRAISMSGVPLSDWAFPFEQTTRAYELAKTMGQNIDNSEDLLNYLQNVPAHDLLNTKPAVLSSEVYWNNGIKMFSFVPVIEKDFGKEQFLVEPIKEALVNGNIEDTDLLIGYTDLEYLIAVPLLESYGLADYNMFKELLVPREILLEISPKRMLSLAEKIHKAYFGNQFINNTTMLNFQNYGGDHIFINSVLRFLRYLPKGRAKRYLYKFFTESSRNRYLKNAEKYNIHGCAHTDDLMYLFDAKQEATAMNVDSDEYQLINQTCTLFTNFVKYGNPTPDDALGVTWPEYNNDDRPYLSINNKLTTGTHLDFDVTNFWDDIYRSCDIELP